MKSASSRKEKVHRLPVHLSFLVGLTGFEWARHRDILSLRAPTCLVQVPASLVLIQPISMHKIKGDRFGPLLILWSG
jgi:hypothetical protein